MSPHHFTKATVQASAWCPTCNKMTMHYIWDGRLGRCMNEHSPASDPQQAQMNLFDSMDQEAGRGKT